MNDAQDIMLGGLSPLARGTRDDSIAADESERFIPAGAGNSAGNITNKINVNGLSPLARGTHAFIRRVWLRLRFIPAGAGNSRNEALDCRNYAVYPRWRGELILFAAESLCRYGLSPLARGTPPIFPYRRVAERFIPAGAGNSLNITYY